MVFGMEDSIMSQAVDLCDNLPVNLNKLAQTQSRLASDNENGGQQDSMQKAPFNCKDYEQNKLDKDIWVGQLEEDQDEVMKEEEDISEDLSLIRCQSPETPMTDSSYSETGSLLETPYALSPGTSTEPAPSLSLIEGPDKENQSSELDLGYSNSDLSVTKPGSSEKYTENILDRNLNPKIGPSPNQILQCVSIEDSHYSGSGDWETLSFAEMETSKPSCNKEINMNQEPSQLVGFLDQLSKRGDDTHLPLYLHQIAEAFVSHEDYQRAIWCVQLERLYHQRLLDNLSALQKQWETRCNTAVSAPAAQHLDTLRQICLTHSWPKSSDAVCASLDHLIVPSCSSDCQAKGTMEQLKRAEDSSGSSLLSPSIDLGGKLESFEVTECDQEDGKSERKDTFHQAQLNEEGCKGDEPEGGPEGTMSAQEDGGPPSCTDDMDQSKTAEQQEGGLSPAQEQEADTEEPRDVEEATEALEMDDEEEGEEEGQNGKAFTFCPERLPVETVVSAAAVEIRLQESRSEPEETQLSPEDAQDIGKICLPPEMPVSEDDDLNEPFLDDEKEEEEEDYEVEQADLLRAAAALDNLAKMITVEELVPAPGLVSILKKRVSSPASAGAEHQSNKLPTKRRVRFKVPDDGFDNEMGGGDSCLLLFLLCLVTVVISIGGTALYCALGDPHSSVCQDFSRNADFYFGQIQRGISQIQHWFTPTS
ncbi:consortin isoform X2 [Boleophthalmus pectinirostris]|uniref:consortin isoform X2 n=1 Tax=Boleophthalmus pectinirostris TaxID=150288 RepID=UPI00242CB98F|nr:consortin isoform X2 [Boleophthalmus pectinirostris]